MLRCTYLNVAEKTKCCQHFAAMPQSQNFAHSASTAAQSLTLKSKSRKIILDSTAYSIFFGVIAGKIGAKLRLARA
jgi:hypothetical protein